MTFRIPAKTLTQIEEARANLVDTGADIIDLGTILRGLVDDFREQYSNRSERWQESDKGEATSTWLDTLEELAEKVEEAGSGAIEAADDLVGIPAEPEV